YSTAEQSVLHDINFRIGAGQVIALVGASGSGKTTIIDLLNRFYDVTAGTIEINGIDIRRYFLKDIRKFSAIVSQDPIVFNDTIHNNITLGREGAKMEDVIRAAKVAQAHEFIENTEHGYQTFVGDRGVRLSGGQLQRITLARAVLKDAPLLILDEATSALDSESERAVQQALGEIVRDKTVVIIAHRLSTIQHADEIIVMKDGRIIERGKHEDLVSHNGEYKKFVQLQAF
ncbi:MAG: ATP-binding cassette domain-containing protein, partial [Saprospiraceae bacterium]|nr:ATP-binding cassette domain-containing protein [Saprospiraceae bacterium]